MDETPKVVMGLRWVERPDGIADILAINKPVLQQRLAAPQIHGSGIIFHDEGWSNVPTEEE